MALYKSCIIIIIITTISQSCYLAVEQPGVEPATFQAIQPVWPQYIDITDRWMDRRQHWAQHYTHCAVINGQHVAISLTCQWPRERCIHRPAVWECWAVSSRRRTLYRMEAPCGCPTAGRPWSPQTYPAPTCSVAAGRTAPTAQNNTHLHYDY